MNRAMRHAQRGGYAPAGQQQRERLRMQAAGRCARDDGIDEIARNLPTSPLLTWTGLARIIKRKLKKI